MHRADRFHCCRVARCLEASGAPPYVLKAALLHDLGKPSSYGLFARTLAVLNFPFAPFSAVKKNHPREGAKKLEGVLTKESLELILFHHEKGKEIAASFPWLKELQEADNLN
ncbi:MAG TPA: HD domain-containing protein [Chroococcales cyanobacterium]